MMQAHQRLKLKALDVGGAIDAWLSGMSRGRIHAQAAWARALSGKPPIEYVPGPASPHTVVEESALARLLKYPARGQRLGTPILVVASLINRYYVLDLLPEISVIRQLNGRGFDVYVLDWKAPGAPGAALTFADYVDGAIKQAAKRAVIDSASDGVAVIGYCMGGTLATLFAARHPDLVRALCLLGTPIDFHASGELAKLTTPELFDVDLMMDVLGNMPPALMQSGFKVLNPIDALRKVVDLTLRADDESFVRHFVALESWLDDNIAFPGGLYREYIRELYQNNRLVDGTFRVGGDLVDLKKLTAPLLNVIALRDHICAPPASRALMSRVGSTTARALEFETGHIGLTASRRSLEKLWPQIATWLEEQTRARG